MWSIFGFDSVDIWPVGRFAGLLAHSAAAAQGEVFRGPLLLILLQNRYFSYKLNFTTLDLFLGFVHEIPRPEERE
jgi:hypothetical protein